MHRLYGKNAPVIRIIAIGKKHEQWIAAGVERYEKRLKKPFVITWELLAHSTYEGNKARQEESERLSSRLRDDEFVVLLDERGDMMNSPALSRLFETQQVQGKSVVCVIGGAYGVTEELYDRADAVLSLSRLVFPHQLVRLILIEQIYRAQEIARGAPYHHS